MNLSLQHAINTPFLTHEEEINLFNNYKQKNCLKSVERLIMSNLLYVKKVSRQYSRPTVSDEDLFQEGVVGLMKAIANFDINRKIRFIGYAIPYIKGEILDFIVRHVSIVKTIVSKQERKLFFNLHNMRGESDRLSRTDVKRISSDLNVSEYDVIDMDKRLNNPDYSLDFQLDDGDNIVDMIPDSNDTSYLTLREYDEKFELIQDGIHTLNDREKYIFLSRNLTESPSTFYELGAELDITHQRASQIEKAALTKIKEYVLNRLTN